MTESKDAFSFCKSAKRQREAFDMGASWALAGVNTIYLIGYVARRAWERTVEETTLDYDAEEAGFFLTEDAAQKYVDLANAHVRKQYDEWVIRWDKDDAAAQTAYEGRVNGHETTVIKNKILRDNGFDIQDPAAPKPPKPVKRQTYEEFEQTVSHNVVVPIKIAKEG